MLKKFVNHYFVFAVICVFIEQSLVAFSTYCTTNLGKTAGSYAVFMFWLVLFFISLILVLIPRLVINVLLNKSKYKVFNGFINEYNVNLYNHPYLKNNSIFNESHSAFFTNQTWITVNDTYNFFRDFLTIILNLILNAFVICLTLSSVFLIGYFCAFAIVLFCIICSRKKVKKYNIDVQNSQAAMNGTLSSGWSSILIGNKYNWCKWQKNFYTKLIAAQKYSVKSAKLTGEISVISMLLSVLPIVVVIIFILSTNRNNMVILTTLIVTLPRQVNILQNMSILIEYGMLLTGIMASLNNIVENMGLPEKLNQYQGNINWDKLYIFYQGTKKSADSVDSIQKLTNNFGNGRYTIRGENGSGKSTLLMKLKEMYGDCAFYLPSSSELYFERSKGSTGERMLSNLQEFLMSKDAKYIKVILLDEWDANLDTHNIKYISKKLDKIAQEKCIIEVRHRDNEENTILRG